MMANEPLAPYDQNKLSNHKLSIAKCWEIQEKPVPLEMLSLTKFMK
jgi:hypothetical protein